MFLLVSCSSNSELSTIDVPPGGDSAYQWSELKHRSIDDEYRGEVFGYRAYFDSLVKPIYADSCMSFGIIIPRSGIVASGRESIMRFGTDSMYGAISYKYIYMYEESHSSSLLLDILIPPTKNQTWEEQNKRTVIPIGAILEGSFRLKTNLGNVSFYFEHFRESEFSADSIDRSGYLFFGPDSFAVRTSYNPAPLYATNGKRWHLAQGYSLLNHDTVVAFLQHQPLPKMDLAPRSRKYLYLSTGLSPELKMVISGYFALVSRVLTLAGMETFY